MWKSDLDGARAGHLRGAVACLGTWRGGPRRRGSAVDGARAAGTSMESGFR
jgi:hypothetical protein